MIQDLDIFTVTVVNASTASVKALRNKLAELVENKSGNVKLNENKLAICELELSTRDFTILK